MAKKNNFSKKIVFTGVLILFTILLSLFTFSYYTNTFKFLNDSRKADGYSGYALEREANDFIVDGCGTGTMLDTVTGLCWSKDMNLGTYSWSTNSAYDEPGWDGSGYVWPSGRSDTDYPAFKVCNDLTTGGNTDWRLPRKVELFSLTDEIGSLGSTCTTLGGFGFTNCQNNDYYTANEAKYSDSRAWQVDLNYDYDGITIKTTGEIVTCVRDDFDWCKEAMTCSTDSDGDNEFSNTCITYPQQCSDYEGNLDPDDSNSTVVPDMSCVYADNRSGCESNFIVDGCGSGTVLDSATGICWQRDFSTAGQRTWANALTYCNGLSLGGHSDWYLPSRQELVSIVDLSRSSPAVVGGNNNIFTSVQNNWYWTSSTRGSSTANAWYVNLYLGTDSGSVKTNIRYVACAR